MRVFCISHSGVPPPGSVTGSAVEHTRRGRLASLQLSSPVLCSDMEWPLLFDDLHSRSSITGMCEAETQWHRASLVKTRVRVKARCHSAERASRLGLDMRDAGCRIQVMTSTTVLAPDVPILLPSELSRVAFTHAIGNCHNTHRECAGRTFNRVAEHDVLLAVIHLDPAIPLLRTRAGGARMDSCQTFYRENEFVCSSAFSSHGKLVPHARMLASIAPPFDAYYEGLVDWYIAMDMDYATDSIPIACEALSDGAWQRFAQHAFAKDILVRMDTMKA